MKTLVPLGAEADLFVIGAELDGDPSSSSSRPGLGLEVEGDPAMGVGPPPPRLTLTDVPVPADAVLGATDGTTYVECVRLSRLAWCALAVGTAQAVLDYVTPYVKEREAFGEPIAHRQSVAFMVANIAIELQSMRLLTYKAASGRRRQGVRPRGRSGAQALRRQGHADRSRRRAAPRRPRVRQGAPGRAVVPRPAAIGVMEERAVLVINLDDQKFRTLAGQAHQVAMNMLRPLSRTYDRPSTSTPRSSTCSPR